ncbi:MAG: hypothetical protein IJ493_12880 [Clostridia bacterium]|nr:hypothetical protein [Clostridia bacterium]
MSENRNSFCGCRSNGNGSTFTGNGTASGASAASTAGAAAGIGAGSVLIDTYQVFDSCRDRDCFEDVRVYLDEAGQCIIEHTGQVRTKSAEICSSAISVEPVQLSRGFYRVTVRFYVHLELEACTCPGKPQCFNGVAAVEKSVVLFGGEGSVRIFRSNAVSDSFCSRPCSGEMTTNLPVAVVEAVDPVILGTRVIDPSSGCSCSCCCSCEDMPEQVVNLFGGIVDSTSRQLAVSLGFFSVIRLERPEQYLINAVEFSVPDKECPVNEDDSPCDTFRRMAFPTEEFAPGRTAAINTDNGCGCHRDHDRDDDDCDSRGSREGRSGDRENREGRSGERGCGCR